MSRAVGAAAIPGASRCELAANCHDGASPKWKALPRIAGDGPAALRTAIRARSPVVLGDLAVDWPALSEWSPERLAERFGERPVQVYDASFGAPGRNYMGSIDTMPFACFLEETQQRGRDLRMFLYNLARQIPELIDDIRLPDVGLRFSRRFVFSFFGCQGSTTPLHYDIDMGDVLHTVVRGRRRVRLFPPSASVALYRHPCTVRSYVDLDDTNGGDRFPARELGEGIEVVLEAGDTLYMPAGWWHEFHYLEAGVGVSLRAASPCWRDRVAGLRNLLLLSPVDRLANRIAPKRWYSWKSTRAKRRAEALLARSGGRGAERGHAR